VVLLTLSLLVTCCDLSASIKNATYSNYNLEILFLEYLIIIPVIEGGRIYVAIRLLKLVQKLPHESRRKILQVTKTMMAGSAFSFLTLVALVLLASSLSNSPGGRTLSLLLGFSGLFAVSFFHILTFYIKKTRDDSPRRSGCLDFNVQPSTSGNSGVLQIGQD